MTPDQLRTALPGLQDVSERAVIQLARSSVLRAYQPSASLYRAGDQADGLYIVLAGRVVVRRETTSRSEMLHTELPGGVLGEIPIFGGGPFPATATALEKTRCAHVPVDVINRLLNEEPSFARFALRRMAARAESLLRRIDALTATTITSRLAAFIAERAAQSRGPDFTLGMTQAALANELGTAREVIVRSISALVDSGAITRTGRSRFAVRKLSALRAGSQT